MGGGREAAAFFALWKRFETFVLRVADLDIVEGSWCAGLMHMKVCCTMQTSSMPGHDLFALRRGIEMTKMVGFVPDGKISGE